MSLKYFFTPLILLFILSAVPAAGQGNAIADFTFSDVTNMPASLLKNSVQGAPDAISINERTRSDGEGIYTLNDPNDPNAHINIELKIPKDMLEAHKSIYLEWDYKNVEGEGESAWLINSGENLNFGIFHHSEAGFKIRYYTLDETRAGAAADGFLTEFIPYPLAIGERAVIAFHYSQEEGMAYLYKNGEVIWKTTDSKNPDTGEFYEATPGHKFYWNTQYEELVVGYNMNAGWTETPTLFRFRAFPEACSNDTPPIIVQEETQTWVCGGESATLVATAEEAEGYQWYTGSSPDDLTEIEGATGSTFTTDPLSSDQSFWVTVQRGPCESEPVMVSVQVIDLPQMPQATDVEQCGPSEFTLQASSNEESPSYQWYRSSGESLEPIPGETGSSFTPGYLSQTTTYYVSVSNEEGCESEPKKVEAIVHEVPDIPVVEVNPEVRCGPGEVTVTIQTPAGKDYTYNWYRNIDENSIIEEKTSNSITLEVSKDTSFYVRAVNEGCIGPHNRVSIQVSPEPRLEADASQTTLLKGESVSLSASFNPDSVDESSFRWEPAQSLEQPFSGTSMASPQLTTTYTLFAESVDGCPLSDTVTVFVVDEFPVTNAFSPNGDGYQDTWEIHNLDQDKYSSCKIMVYNGWGNKVFYSEGYDKSKEWDGTFNGQPLPAGTYYYTIILNETQEPLRGSLFIMR